MPRVLRNAGCHGSIFDIQGGLFARTSNLQVKLPRKSALAEGHPRHPRSKYKKREDQRWPSLFWKRITNYFATCMRCVITPAVVVICKK